MYQNNYSVHTTQRALRLIFGRHNRAEDSVIRVTIYRLRTTFNLVNNAYPQRCQTVRTAVQSIEVDQNESIRYPAQQLELCQTTLWQIFQKNLGLGSYEIQLMQELKFNEMVKSVR